ncbi:MAG: hypothetical protein EA376_09625 [Phycisphaeraceae bacterium]|nr:MAG: hypothetical protein EA376_09625 [Phycisphaeraceae bacterium]
MPERPDDLVPVITVASEFEAGVIVAALREEGVEARQSVTGIQSILGSSAGSLITPVQVLAPRKDVERAKGMLARMREESVDIDWSEVDVGEGESVEEERRSVREMRKIIMILIAAALVIFFLMTMLTGGTIPMGSE